MHLLDLPVEIRLEIYSYLLVTQDYDKLRPVPGGPRLSLGTPLLRTCKQINAEATPVLYGSNLLLADMRRLTKQARLRLRSRPFSDPKMLAMVRRWWLTVPLDVEEPFYEPEDAGAAFANVDELVLEFMSSFAGNGAAWRRAALRPFEAVRGVKTVRIVGCPAELEVYADWLKRSMMSRQGSEMQPYVGSP
ncbi:hypothetical protein UCRPA7_1545 [Phaeoacremonium minimum UCRPA7]|uniref:F-box domain-containing protein n=1 Tax=Phaeoacremonium minimum (strain UCR-PA7) TaxID=1286976 RepID=R8BU83_PHAM7|nr:hypothetical protein UCRPA7_1545 [Phaeoacremonium minimum UCRPA7]EOO02948.1 hypothetical protein UCRPA7_1545 [Phaeoacremonium minimum UCRPA7]